MLVIHDDFSLERDGYSYPWTRLILEKIGSSIDSFSMEIEFVEGVLFEEKFIELVSNSRKGNSSKKWFCSGKRLYASKYDYL